jgi:hypothetical protein
MRVDLVPTDKATFGRKIALANYNTVRELADLPACQAQKANGNNGRDRWGVRCGVKARFYIFNEGGEVDATPLPNIVEGKLRKSS